MGDELRERVGDPLEEIVEAVLREDVVEDVRDPPVGLGQRLRARRRLPAGAGVQRTSSYLSRNEMPHLELSFLRFASQGDPPERGTGGTRASLRLSLRKDRDDAPGALASVIE